MANEGGKKGEIAREFFHQRTIPNKREPLTVAAANTAFDLADINGAGAGAVDLRGHWIWLQARGANVTVKRGSVACAAAGDGLVIADGQREEFWVDPDEDTGLQTWASAAGTLDVLYDSRQPPQTG